MNNNQKLFLIGLSELSISLLIFASAVVVKAEVASQYRLWEIFPVLLCAAITTLGLKEMRRRT